MFLSNLFCVLMGISLALIGIDYLVAAGDGTRPLVSRRSDVGLGVLLVAIAAWLFYSPPSLLAHSWSYMIPLGISMVVVGFVLAWRVSWRQQAETWAMGWVAALLVYTSFGLTGMTYIAFAVVAHR